MVDLQREAAPSSIMGIRGSGGEIEEVQGGLIVRSVGRKDRHCKVFTAKGPRDRRVRLAAHTAVQFFDVQDRLGYDRPSKAVDWLIKKAITAIDELEELPAWKPNALNSVPLQQRTKRLVGDGENPFGVQLNTASSSSSLRTTMAGGGCLLPPSLDSDSIADTIKSFLPMGATPSPEIPSSTIQLHRNPPAEDLQLSLQCLKNPLLLHQNEHVFFSGASPLPVLHGVTPANWAEQVNNGHPPPEIGRFQKMPTWNSSGNGGDQHGAANGRSFIFNLPPNPAPPPLLQPLFVATQIISQRGPLQSSNTPMFHAWIDPSLHQSPFSGDKIDSGGFPEFQIPVRIQSVEDHKSITDKPSSASSDLRH